MTVSAPAKRVLRRMAMRRVEGWRSLGRLERARFKEVSQDGVLF